MYDELPEFRKTKHEYAMKFINSVLMGPGGASMVRLEAFEDYHFRAIFKLSYFQLGQEADMPSKSQWNTLKKKMKRRNHSVFVFREYGVITCEESKPESAKNGSCLYIDFGFMYD